MRKHHKEKGYYINEEQNIAGGVGVEDKSIIELFVKRSEAAIFQILMNILQNHLGIILRIRKELRRIRPLHMLI